MGAFGLVLLMAVAALGCFAYALFGLEVARIPADRRGNVRSGRKSSLTSASDGVEHAIEAVLRRRGWMPFPARDLELAGIRMTQSSLVILVAASAFVMFALFSVLQRPMMGIIAAVLVPFLARVWIKLGAVKRQRAFADQLESTMQIMSSALRAGHSFPRALDTVAKEAEVPTSEEFTRIVNENRLGRDLIEAMRETGFRMDSEDFGWVTDAVAIQRDTGGNLSEVLDRVATTIRERNELKQQIHALSAEGRISMIVLMGLPIIMALFYSLVNPGYLDPLFASSLGRILIGFSAVMYVIGYIWMRALIKVKF